MDPKFLAETEILQTISNIYLSEMSCDFENDLCNWRQSSEDEMDWTLMSGSTPSAETGPTGDHTSSVGMSNMELLNSLDIRFKVSYTCLVPVSQGCG